jgi:hypothetical protein
LRNDNGGHAGCGGAGDLGAFEEANTLLEHRDGGVCKARILKARVFVLEAGLGLFCGMVDEALGQEERFGGLAELRAQHAAVDELRFRAPALGIGGDGRLLFSRLLF